MHDVFYNRIPFINFVRIKIASQKLVVSGGLHFIPTNLLNCELSRKFYNYLTHETKKEIRGHGRIVILLTVFP